MLKKIKQNFRILPIFIFICTLMISIRVNHIVGNFKTLSQSSISVSQSQAFAEDVLSKETAQLNTLLDGGEINLSSKDGSKNTKFTQSEIMILQELAERRESLDIRSREIDKKAVQLKVAETEIDKKLKQLQEYEAKLKKLIKEYNIQEKEKLTSLARLYASMKPKDAARIFNTLDLDIGAALINEMKPSASSAILSQMEAQKAKAITDELIGKNI